MKANENIFSLDTEKKINGLKQISRCGFSYNSGFNAKAGHLIYATGRNIIVDTIGNLNKVHLVGHDNFVSCTCVSNNQLIASGQLASPGSKNYDSPVLLWKIGTPNPIARFFGLKEGVKALIFSKDCNFLAGVSFKDQLIIWNIKTQSEMYMKNFQSPVLVLNFSNDNVVIVCGKTLQNISLIPLLSQNKPPIYTNFTLPSTGLPRIYTSSIEFSSGNYLIGTESGQLCIFTKLIFKNATIVGKGKVFSIATPNQKQFYIAVGNQLCKFALANQQLKQIDRKPIDPVRTISISEKGQIYGISNNSILRITQDLKFQRLKVSHASKVNCVHYRNGIIASIDQEGTILIQTYKNFQMSVLNIWRSNLSPGKCIQVSSASIVAGYADGKIVSLSLDGKKQQWQIVAHKGSVTCIYTAQSYFLSGGEDCVVRIWSKAHQLINQLSVHQKAVSKVLGDCAVLSTIHSCSLDRSIQGYDLKNDKKVYFKQAIGGNITDMIQDCKSGDLITCGFGSAVSFWKINDHQPYKNFKSNNFNVAKIGINPDGTLVVLGHQNGIISVLNTKKNESMGSLYSHSAAITAISWIDNNTFVTSSQDYCVALWSIS